MDEAIFYQVDAAIKALNITESPAYVHGLLVGLSCVKNDINPQDWFRQILPQENADLSDDETLQQLFDETQAQLTDPMLGFSLLLELTTSSLDVQMRALRDWAQGFLSGLGLAKIKTDNKAVLTTMTTLSQLVKVDDFVEDNEENWQDFVEIVEFIKVAVLLAHTELANKPSNT